MAPCALEDQSPVAVGHTPALSLQLESLQPKFVTTDENEPHENEWYRNFSTDYTVTEKSLHTTRPLRMIIIGAGASGLNIAYKAARQLSNASFQIYEKNSDVGGTWLENRYPGCTCDIPSHSYQWSYWRNPEWSSYYSSSEEIWRYLKNWAVAADLERHVKFEHRVKEARWVEGEGVWEVEVQGPDGRVLVDRGEVLASCQGVLK